MNSTLNLEKRSENSDYRTYLLEVYNINKDILVWTEIRGERYFL